MKKLHAPNHNYYEQYNVHQAKQKGGNVPTFHGTRFQRGYGLGSRFNTRVTGKKALQTGVNVAQDNLDGDNLKTAVRKQAKQAIGNITSWKSQQGQSGASQKGTKRKAQSSKISSPPGKKAKASPHAKKPRKGNLTEFFSVRK